MRPLARGAQTPKNSIIERFDIENSHLRRGLEVLCSKTSLKHQLAQRMKYPMVILIVVMFHFKHRDPLGSGYNWQMFTTIHMLKLNVECHY